MVRYEPPETTVTEFWPNKTYVQFMIIFYVFFDIYFLYLEEGKKTLIIFNWGSSSYILELIPHLFSVLKYMVKQFASQLKDLIIYMYTCISCALSSVN